MNKLKRITKLIIVIIVTQHSMEKGIKGDDTISIKLVLDG